MEISPADLKERLENPELSPFLLDVREPDEFEDWRIEGSLNLPLETLARRETLRSLPRDKEIIAICLHGIRSAEAASYLRQRGFQARNMAGGLSAWNKIHDIAPLSLHGQNGFRLFQVRRIGKGCASYVATDGDGAVVVDPSIHTEEYLSLAKKARFRIRHVIDTHQHADHISGARALSKATGAELHLNPIDPYSFRDFTPLKHEDTINFGDNATIRAIHTPGHTKGSTSLLIQERTLLTGDILFLEGIARPDLHDRAPEFADDLYETYKRKLLKLPPDTVILPAHFSRLVKVEFGKPFQSTLEEVRQRLPLLEAPRQEFLAYVLEHIPPTPPNYEAILTINRGLDEYDSSVFDELEEGPNRCALRA